jgi:hypothetical protein
MENKVILRKMAQKSQLIERENELWTIAQMLGSVKYDSVRPCVRCGCKQRYVSNKGCVVCQLVRATGKAAKQRRIHMALTRLEAQSTGQRYYYPIHRCRHGHRSRWRVRDDVCMMCTRKEASQELHRREAAAEKVAEDLQHRPKGTMTDAEIMALLGEA